MLHPVSKVTSKYPLKCPLVCIRDRAVSGRPALEVQTGQDSFLSLDLLSVR